MGKKRKAKTKKSLLKRIKITAKKKILRKRAGRRHLLSSKSKKRKRALRQETLVSHTERKILKRALPYHL